eukprot:13539197-Ditylum_brightwellii.AAC.1
MTHSASGRVCSIMDVRTYVFRFARNRVKKVLVLFELSGTRTPNTNASEGNKFLCLNHKNETASNLIGSHGGTHQDNQVTEQ